MAPLFLAFSLIIVVASSAQGLLVDNFGQVNGLEEQVMTDITIECFLGIPFAKPPIENRRFLPPEPLPPPDNASAVEYDATKLPASCYQIIDNTFDDKFVKLWNPNTNMSEDCLYLNIWRRKGASNQAVMVWIYGGGFASGTSTLDLYDGKILAAREVILVSMQYRVGPLGFLSMGSKSAPGNVGLLDQQLALQWVQEHIADFGGDPTRVTIFGESAGAASIGLHMLSDGSNDLFRSAIMQSAAAGAPWAFIEIEKAKKAANKLAQLVGCSSDDIDCMRKKSADLLTEKQNDAGDRMFNFVPTTDDKFLKQNPRELLDSGKFQRKNILLGLNSHEGSFFIIYEFPKRFVPTNVYNSNITNEEYLDMVKELNLVDSSSDVVDDTISSIYSLPCGDDDALPYLKSLGGMLGDVWFKCPVIHTAKAYAKEASEESHQVYVYTFNHHSNGNPWPEWSGDALHGYEIDHVFGIPRRSSDEIVQYSQDEKVEYTNEERRLTDNMMTFWTNFAKTMDPNKFENGRTTTQKWPKYSTDDREVIVLDAIATDAHLQSQAGLRDGHCKFWSETVPALLTATSSASSTFNSISLLLTAFLFSIVVFVL